MIQDSDICGFRYALDQISKEKQYLAWTEAPPLESATAFVRDNIEKGIPQLVALDEGKVIGWCDITPHPRATRSHCGILGMGIIKGYRHKGIGTKLIQAALAAAKSYGYEKVELEVFDSNGAAIGLYEKAGFIYEGKSANAVKIDGRYFACIHMALFLKGHEPPDQGPTESKDEGSRQNRQQA